MGINPLIASQNIVETYLRYIETTFYIHDKEYMEKFRVLLRNKEFFAKGPYLDLTDSFEFGKSIDQLVDERILSKEFKVLYRRDSS